MRRICDKERHFLGDGRGKNNWIPLLSSLCTSYSSSQNRVLVHTVGTAYRLSGEGIPIYIQMINIQY